MTRLETGPVQVADDWPGVFIRGDNALLFAMVLQSVLNRGDIQDHPFEHLMLTGLMETLKSCNANNDPKPVRILRLNDV